MRSEPRGTAPTPGNRGTVTCVSWASPSSVPAVPLRESPELRPQPGHPVQRQLRHRSPHGPGWRGGRRAEEETRRGNAAPPAPGPLWAPPARVPRGAAGPARERAPPAASSPHMPRPPFLPLPSSPPAGATHHITPRSGRDGAMRGRKGREGFPSPRQPAGRGHVAEAPARSRGMCGPACPPSPLPGPPRAEMAHPGT